MSVDARLSTIVEEASETLKSSVRDAVAGALLHLPLPMSALRDVAKRAYELGYREALASQGHTAGDTLAALARSAGTPAGAQMGASGNVGDDDDFEDLDWVDDPVDATPSVMEQHEPASSAEAATTSVDWSTFDLQADPTAETNGVTADTRPRPPSLRIFPHASVATLRQRIVDVFDLSRFQIDVVVCRKGDRTRRQLKGSVKLSKYLVEG